MNRRRLYLLVLYVALAVATPRAARADGPPTDFDRNQGWRKPQVTATVETRSDGVYVRISVRDETPGEQRHAPAPDAAAETRGETSASVQRPAASGRGAAQSVSTARRDRFWTDVDGIHRQTADGHTYLLTPPPIGAGGLDGWTNDLRQHPNETPYLLYADGQYSGVVWIPQSPQGNNVQIEVQTPSSSGRSGGRPSGNGDSTDPREVALDALGHVPLPNIHLQVNPSLGLVHLAGWFWVEGYDGQPFGIERRVTVPPEVGPEVPLLVVPADDPRRQETHFTVEVRLWTSHYEWDFGDGKSLVTTSLGKPHPAESDIQHTYEYSSLGFADGFPVRLTVTFEAEYRVNGGALVGLPSIQQTYEYSYRVQEVQSVLTQR